MMYTEYTPTFYIMQYSAYYIVYMYTRYCIAYSVCHKIRSNGILIHYTIHYTYTVYPVYTIQSDLYYPRFLALEFAFPKYRR